MTEPHMKRAAEWFLTLREIPLDRAHELITPPPRETPTESVEQAEEAIWPAPYGTALSADEGLWLRAGWAGKG